VQNLQVISSSEAAGVTTIRFSRPLNTGDAAEDRVIGDGELTLTWAYGTADGDPSTLQYTIHQTRGTAQLNLLANEQTPPGGADTAGALPNLSCSSVLSVVLASVAIAVL
jgi:hypothetical protein